LKQDLAKVRDYSEDKISSPGLLKKETTSGGAKNSYLAASARPGQMKSTIASYLKSKI